MPYRSCPLQPSPGPYDVSVAAPQSLLVLLLPCEDTSLYVITGTASPLILTSPSMADGLSEEREVYHQQTCMGSRSSYLAEQLLSHALLPVSSSPTQQPTTKKIGGGQWALRGRRSGRPIHCRVKGTATRFDGCGQWRILPVSCCCCCWCCCWWSTSCRTARRCLNEVS